MHFRAFFGSVRLPPAVFPKGLDKSFGSAYIKDAVNFICVYSVSDCVLNLPGEEGPNGRFPGLKAK